MTIKLVLTILGIFSAIVCAVLFVRFTWIKPALMMWKQWGEGSVTINFFSADRMRRRKRDFIIAVCNRCNNPNCSSNLPATKKLLCVTEEVLKVWLDDITSTEVPNPPPVLDEFETTSFQLNEEKCLNAMQRDMEREICYICYHQCTLVGRKRCDTMHTIDKIVDKYITQPIYNNDINKSVKYRVGINV